MAANMTVSKCKLLLYSNTYVKVTIQLPFLKAHMTSIQLRQ